MFENTTTRQSYDKARSGGKKNASVFERHAFYADTNKVANHPDGANYGSVVDSSVLIDVLSRIFYFPTLAYATKELVS